MTILGADLDTSVMTDGDLGVATVVEVDIQESEMLDGDMIIQSELDGSMTAPDMLIGEMGIIQTIVETDADIYDGVTEVTPSRNQQVLDTAGFFVTKNIVINPIPKNYGLVEWNGACLTVS